jgi:hypothetical protein
MDNATEICGDEMMETRQAEKFLRRLKDEKRPSNEDILGAVEQSFIRQIEKDSDLKVHRLFGGYYVRRRFFAGAGREVRHHFAV